MKQGLEVTMGSHRPVFTLVKCAIPGQVERRAPQQQTALEIQCLPGGHFENRQEIGNCCMDDNLAYKSHLLS